MNRHEGVSCDACLKGNFRGRRYKCLMCFDYDLCAQCYEQGATSTRHNTDHAMQCILTRADFELYYGGEGFTVDQPQSFTCPYCGRMGFTDVVLQEHVCAEHPEMSLEVICPVCASMIGGDPNMVTDDLAGHLGVEHRAGGGTGNGPRDLIQFLDDPSVSAGPSTSGAGTRHGMRRTTHGPRGVTGSRPRRSSMHFNSAGGLSSLSPSARDTVDPIAELLSQLSGVRRSAGTAIAVSSPQVASTQLQQLQMQLQLERQQVTLARQQLERLPRRQNASANLGSSTATNLLQGSSTNAGVSVSVSSGAISGSNSLTPAINPVILKHVYNSSTDSHQQSSSHQFLLSQNIDEPMTEEEKEKLDEFRAYRSLFVKELLFASIATLSNSETSPNEEVELESSQSTNTDSSLKSYGNEDSTKRLDLNELRQALPASQVTSSNSSLATSTGSHTPVQMRVQGVRPRVRSRTYHTSIIDHSQRAATSPPAASEPTQSATTSASTTTVDKKPPPSKLVKPTATSPHQPVKNQSQPR